jgi:hypothetical protein
MAAYLVSYLAAWMVLSSAVSWAVYLAGVLVD